MEGTKKEALQRAFEIWYERAHGEKPERGVLCDYIEDEPLMAWMGWDKGFDIGEKSALALNGAAPALLQALENYIIANRELDIAECQKPSEIRQKRSNLQMAGQSAIAAIAAARGTV